MRTSWLGLAACALLPACVPEPGLGGGYYDSYGPAASYGAVAPSYGYAAPSYSYGYVESVPVVPRYGYGGYPGGRFYGEPYRGEHYGRHFGGDRFRHDGGDRGPRRFDQGHVDRGHVDRGPAVPQGAPPPPQQQQRPTLPWERRPGG